MKIIEYVNSDNVTIKFLDEHGFEKNTTYSNFKNGCIKNPYDKIIFGVGYLGEGKYSAYHKRIYSVMRQNKDAFMKLFSLFYYDLWD